MGGVGEGKDKLTVQTPSSLVLFLEDQEDATVVEEEDKHQEKINLEQDSSGWRIFLEEGTVTAVIVPQHTTTTIMDTTVGTTMVITTGTIMGTIVEGVGPTLVDVSVTTDRHSKTSTVTPMVPVRELTRQEGDGVTLLGMGVLMPGSHRGSLTTLGHTRLVSFRDSNIIIIMNKE